ncbi:MAG: hypothetical protein IPH05_13800 [Flavobacteriales bacterium]|jgi:hypothetical protein|nr:hypothetical protein [Flavobacteriales bacterium]MBK7100375.1 hypothetical protein [Flavobacteriales bacterium]MBK7111069.1 hypothetical protein [Flavobacteriales bacterium]MBK8533537.1 hypothetical protein [Flavobacteriales bacterium]MBK8706969.1 hypothetical protein [Flavobacteriales bacterium]
MRKPSLVRYSPRSLGAILLILLVGQVFAQSGVEGLMNASDAGQRMFDQRSSTPQLHTGRIYERKKVDKEAEYPGGEDALLDHLLEPALCGVLPKMETCFGTSKMTFDFVVNTDGSVSDVEFLKDGCPVLQPHVRCAIRGLSIWTPAELDGLPVRMRSRASVKFDLR